MPTSWRKLISNRANAQKSTGPTSPEGKAKVSQNRAVHGLTGRFRVIDSEDQDTFDDFLDQLIVEEQPVGTLEVELVKKMAESLWMSRRARNLQDPCFVFMERSREDVKNSEVGLVVRPELERYTRYQAHHDRAFQRYSNELSKHRKERLKAQAGFESQQRAKRQEERRDAKENRDIEQHKHAVAHAEKRLQLIETKRKVAEKKLDTAPPPQNQQIAA